MNIDENYITKRILGRLRTMMASGTGGTQGPAGPAGKDGINGTDGKNGRDGVDGKDGAKGADSTVPGPAGATGPTGATGATGAAGKDGTNATVAAASYGSRTPALNTAFQISATRDAQVIYPIDVTINSLLTDVDGLAFLEYADNAAMTTNLVTVMSAGQLLGGVINIKNRGTVTLMGRIPAGKYVRIRTNNVAGTPTFSARQGQEVLI